MHSSYGCFETKYVSNNNNKTNGVNLEKVPSFHLEELLNYYLSRSARNIKYREFISVIKRYFIPG